MVSSCKTTKTVQVEEPIIEERILDEVVVTAPAEEPEIEIENELPTYRASATREFDLIHTKLDIAFDWEKQHVLGKAELTLKPYFYSSDVLTLDAKVFDIHSIKLNGQDLKYDYDFKKLKIDLGKVYTKDESIVVNIDYTAKPNEGPSGGSAAIMSDKGLFFINPKKIGDKPQQIWTQGETENSSRWFPTIDKPNERCSQEIYITVEDKFKTLSNGALVSSKTNGNGTRTDHWKQEKPHAPYLFMIGIGDYAVVEDTWNGLPLMYYVEPAYQDAAETIFNHTPEMLTFFSDILGYEYPWDKYAQIVCRDYVSGAMENTGAVVFGEFVQKTKREFLDSDNDDIVAHEMIHHWFGDLVTCESWSNLTLNEGFATYGEYLWREYKYGHESAERKRMQDLNGYLMSANQQGVHDLIDFEYGDKEQMFDGHSYNKGGLIVHMLRNYVGDEAFFAALNKYLTRNEYTDVEAHELRLAFEDVTGEDLNWFFDQWFYDQGHPVLAVDYNIDAESKSVLFSVSQEQDPEESPAIFRLPIKIALYYPSGKVEYVDETLDQRQQEITVNVEGDEMPAVAMLDGTHDLLAIINQSLTDKEYAALYELSSEYEDKNNALKKLKGKTEYEHLFADALEHPSHHVRSIAVNAIDGEKYKKQLSDLALNDPKSSVRSAALYKIKDLGIAEKLVAKDQSYRVIGTAFSIISEQDEDQALKIAEKLSQSYHKPLIPKFAELFAATKDEKHLPFFEENIGNVGLYGFFNFMSQYVKIAKEASTPNVVNTAEVLKSVALDNSSIYFKRYSATNNVKTLLSEMKSRYGKSESEEDEKAKEQLETMMSDIISKTTDVRLKNAFSEYATP